MKCIPQKLLKPLSCVDGRPEPSASVILRVEGVARCLGSDDDTNNFVAALRLMVRKYISYDPEPEKIGCGVPISAKWLAVELELPLISDPNSIRRLIALLEVEGLVSNNEHA
jgi:hypothetical protein